MSQNETTAHCECSSKDSGLCCPVDKELRKTWLDVLETEHEKLRKTSIEIADNFKLFSNPRRIEILLMLKQREHCLDEMSRKLKLQKSAVSYHLSSLKKEGLICMNRRSRFSFYSLSRNGMTTISKFESF